MIVRKWLRRDPIQNAVAHDRSGCQQVAHLLERAAVRLTAERVPDLGRHFAGQRFGKPISFFVKTGRRRFRGSRSQMGQHVPSNEPLPVLVRLFDSALCQPHERAAVSMPVSQEHPVVAGAQLDCSGNRPSAPGPVVIDEGGRTVRPVEDRLELDLHHVRQGNGAEFFRLPVRLPGFVSDVFKNRIEEFVFRNDSGAGNVQRHLSVGDAAHHSRDDFAADQLDAVRRRPSPRPKQKGDKGGHERERPNNRPRGKDFSPRRKFNENWRKPAFLWPVRLRGPSPPSPAADNTHPGSPRSRRESLRSAIAGCVRAPWASARPICAGCCGAH